MPATFRLEPHGTSATWAASGSISLELSPKPFTITRMAIIQRLTFSSVTGALYSDGYDRAITRLNLTGGGKTFFDFSNMRVGYHQSRFQMGAYAPKRIPVPSANGVVQIPYVFHFGVAPYKVNPYTGMIEDNPFDLTGGIPPMGSGNLTLAGAYAAATDIIGAATTTVSAGQLDVYLYGVQPGSRADYPSEAEYLASFMPRAIPAWQMQTPTPTATSTVNSTAHNIPAGDFLHDAMVMTTRTATTLPRDDSVLTSLQVYNARQNRVVMQYGGQASSVLDLKAGEILSQLGHGWPPNDTISTAMTGLLGTAGTPSISGISDTGLINLPLSLYAPGGHPLYGVDLRGVTTGDLQLRYGVANVTAIEMFVFYRKYQLNPDHPANASI